MNTPHAWFQCALFSGALLLITKPLGAYLMRVLDAQGRTFLDPVVKPIERLTYRICGIDPAREQGWVGYTIALLVFSFVGLVF
ncbi:MAG: K+-transporting ATPase, KdpA, partial [Verrucomicrobia bacterium]|nr:K+-transporting ATPase, KdpA [Verrucomicrobiota bacterium]